MLTHHARTKQAGLTLIELTVVLVILGIMALIALPRLSAFQDREVDVATRRFLSTIRAVRQEAMRSRRHLHLRYEVGTGAYQTMVESAGSQDRLAAMLPHGRLPGGVIFQAIETVRLGKMAHGEAATAFSPFGRVERTLVQLRGRGGRVQTVMIHSVAGRTSVLAGEVDFAQL